MPTPLASDRHPLGPLNRRLPVPRGVAEELLGTCLHAVKDGTVASLLSQRPRLSRWFMVHRLRPILGTLGDTVDPSARNAEAIRLWLHWNALGIRPEAAVARDTWDRELWLSRTSFRPMLAILCHFGFMRVPDFPDRYRRREHEPASDNLCGIWAVGPSTFYRYVDKGRRQMLDVLMQPPAPDSLLSLRRFVHQGIASTRLARQEPDAVDAWHLRQAERCRSEDDLGSVLWHTVRARRVPDAIALVRRFRTELAGLAEVDAMLAWIDDPGLEPAWRVELRLAMADIWGTRSAPERQVACWEQALQIAQGANDRLMIGLVYGALGRHYEARDTDRAAAFFRDSSDCLEPLHASSGEADDRIRTAYASSLQGLAWCYVLRNDPRSKNVLDAAESLRNARGVPEETRALLDQIWGEYWRRAADLPRAIEHKHRALNVFLRLGDQRQILSTYNNLSLLYAETKDFERAVRYAKQVLELARSTQVEPYILSNTWLNLGIAHFWQSDLDGAIDAYLEALRIAAEAAITVTANRARFNLAESYFSRFRLTNDPSDEIKGDQYAAEVAAASRTEGDSFLTDAVSTLKTDILGADKGLVHERLAAGDQAAHPQEWREIEGHRATLAMPSSPEERIRSHIAIARLYLAIAMRERDAVLALVEEAGPTVTFDAELQSLDAMLAIDLPREKTLLAAWRRTASGVVSDNRMPFVVRHLLDAGWINKSGYAEVGLCGLATASKHLSRLVELGLLRQTGKGPSTRYSLPEG